MLCRCHILQLASPVTITGEQLCMSEIIMYNICNVKYFAMFFRTKISKQDIKSSAEVFVYVCCSALPYSQWGLVYTIFHTNILSYKVIFWGKKLFVKVQSISCIRHSFWATPPYFAVDSVCVLPPQHSVWLGVLALRGGGS